MLALLLPALAFAAAPLLDPAGSYSVKPEHKNSGVAPRPLPNAYVEMKMNFESFDLNDKSGQPLLTNQTDQLLRLKELPTDPKDSPSAKEGLDHRMELTFERLTTASTVRVEGLAKPFSTRSDLGIFLMNKPIVMRGDGKSTKKVEGLEAIRAKVLTDVKDPIARNTLMGLLDESVLLKTGTTISADSSCLSSFDKKKIGEKWTFGGEAQGVKFEYECEFSGWAEAKGKKIAVLKVHSKKQRQQRQQPNGVPGMAETEGKGALYFEPESQESLMKMETEIFVEPMEDEQARLKAKGAVIPKNKSLMKHWNRMYPI